MSKTFEFSGDEQTIQVVTDFLQEHGCRIPPLELQCANEKGNKAPDGICVTICDTVVKLARVYADLMTEKKVEIAFESDSEVFIGRPGDSPEKLESYLKNHTKISLKI
jgi:hypothetical protein